ncbi:MAG: polysaccharide deacetylase family protein [Thermoleophilia bacterium]|nr:polysaccharide deacetylase family protein [Thermoleophilia bacterium]
MPAAALLGLHALPALAGVSQRFAAALKIATRIPDPAGVALTFDDGPHREGTPAVLELLDAAGVSATFFLVGEQVERDRGLAREIAERGHAIGLHCHRHRNLLRLTPRQLAGDLKRARAEIAAATGVQTTLYRPPYGVFSAAGIAIARRNGWRPLLWSKAGNDWQAKATAASIAERVTRDLGPGDVLLLHDADYYSAPDSWRRTAAALPAVLERVAALGLTPTLP